eukprot:401914-Alexandrium_andersonii.AAC.1
MLLKAEAAVVSWGAVQLFQRPNVMDIEKGKDVRAKIKSMWDKHYVGKPALQPYLDEAIKAQVLEILAIEGDGQPRPKKPRRSA